MIELFTTAFITLLVIIDPPGCAPIFASLTSGTDLTHRRKMAVRSTLVAWCILVFFALLGEPLLRTLGISLSAFLAGDRNFTVVFEPGPRRALQGFYWAAGRLVLPMRKRPAPMRYRSWSTTWR